MGGYEGFGCEKCERREIGSGGNRLKVDGEWMGCSGS